MPNTQESAVQPSPWLGRPEGAPKRDLGAEVFTVKFERDGDRWYATATTADRKVSIRCPGQTPGQAASIAFSRMETQEGSPWRVTP